MIWLKTLHVTAVAFWSALLICLPALYVQRALVPDQASLQRLQSMVRFIYVAVLSPAAFISIASGTALIFIRETFEAWFSIKLALVGAMATIHALTGLLIIRLFEKEHVYPPWRFIATTAATLFVVTSILTVVLLKPEIPNVFPETMREPGGLRRMMETINPFRR